MGKIIVLCQMEDSQVNRISLEALSGARQLATATGHTLQAALFGPGDPPEELAGADIVEIIQLPNAELADYSPDYYVAAAAALIAAEQPELLVTGHTYEIRDWLPRLAARLGRPLVSDCIGVRDAGAGRWVRPVFQGKITADVQTSPGLVLVSFQSGTYRADELGSGSPSVRTVSVDLSGVESRVHREEKFQEAKGAVDLSRAERIVAVGRGIGEEENLQLVRDLAEALGAEIASSRPVVDYGWLDHDRQVGSSGQTVAPKLYLALGISGAIQHQVGMKNAGCIVAINKDANAPIFEIADYGIVGDLFDYVPALIKALDGR